MINKEKMLKEAIYESKVIEKVGNSKWFKEIIEPLIIRSLNRGIYIMNSEELVNPTYLAPGIRSNIVVEKAMEEDEKIIDVIKQTIRLAFPQVLIDTEEEPSRYLYGRYINKVENIVSFLVENILIKGYKGEDITYSKEDMDNVCALAIESGIDVTDDYAEFTSFQGYVDWARELKDKQSLNFVALSGLEIEVVGKYLKDILENEEELLSQEERNIKIDDRIKRCNTLENYLEMKTRAREMSDGYVVYYK